MGCELMASLLPLDTHMEKKRAPQYEVFLVRISMGCELMASLLPLVTHMEKKRAPCMKSSSYELAWAVN